MRRLFFGVEIVAPWPEGYPKGRLLEEKNRHLTLAFLGNLSEDAFSHLIALLHQNPPYPHFHIGVAAQFDACLFLPANHAHVVAWQIKWFDETFLLYQKNLSHYLHANHVVFDTRHSFCPHVTVARAPFDRQAWKKQFHPLPLYTGAIQLYESVGQLQYETRFIIPLDPPFEPMAHTADIAYLVRGTTFQELFTNAALALCFSFPLLLSYIEETTPANSLLDVIRQLNQIITRADIDIGCPCKAVSHHATTYQKNNLMHWEMIIDV